MVYGRLTTGRRETKCFDGPKGLPHRVNKELNVRKVFVAFSVLTMLLAPALAATISGSGASGVIERFHEVLLGTMQEAETLGFKGRYSRLEQPVRESFHLAFMARVTAGSHWRRATEEQRRALFEAFTRTSVGTYALRFDGFSGQEFRLLRETSGPGNTKLVVTNIVSPGRDPVELTYVLREFAGSWRIIDVLVEGGISELAVRRSENRAILKQSGLAGLITALNAKADDLIAIRPAGQGR